jgi:translation elongation factor EF-4
MSKTLRTLIKRCNNFVTWVSEQAPDIMAIERIEEPYIRASIITRTDYIGQIMTLCLGKRGELVKQNYISGNRMELIYDLPLGEIVFDFFDRAKTTHMIIKRSISLRNTFQPIIEVEHDLTQR